MKLQEMADPRAETNDDGQPKPSQSARFRVHRDQIVRNNAEGVKKAKAAIAKRKINRRAPTETSDQNERSQINQPNPKRLDRIPDEEAPEKIEGLKGFRWHPEGNAVVDPMNQIYYYLKAHPNGRTYMEILTDIDQEIQRHQELENHEDRYFGTKFKLERASTSRFLVALKKLMADGIVIQLNDGKFRFQQPAYSLSDTTL